MVFRKGKKGDWENYFDKDMILKINSIKSNEISIKEYLIYFIKFTLRLRIKYFLYKFFLLCMLNLIDYFNE